MARTAGQMPRLASLFDPAALVDAALPGWRAGGRLHSRRLQGEDLTARAIAYSGLAALLGLPLLLLASLLLAAPLAAPAGIALGYLAMSHALRSRHPRSAAAIAAVVLLGLVIWSLSVLLAGQGASSAGLAAALLAPMFAAAPAVARFVLEPRTDASVRIARRDTARLEQLAPAEAILAVRRDGTLIAATAAGRAALQLPAVEGDVGRHFALLDRPKLSDAISKCPVGGKIELTLRPERHDAGSEPTCTAEISAPEAGIVFTRLLPPAPKQSAPHRLAEAPAAAQATEVETGPLCDVGDAVAFVMRHAVAKGATLQAEVEEGLKARCDLQMCRRTLALMIEAALVLSRKGDRLLLTARRLKGVVLLRLLCPADAGGVLVPSREPEHGSLAMLREVVDEAGGTFVIDGTLAETRLSVRLAVATPAAGDEQKRWS